MGMLASEVDADVFGHGPTVVLRTVRPKVRRAQRPGSPAVRYGRGPMSRHTPIIGSLAYVWDRTTDTVLLVHRNARPEDEHFGKYNGLGGKLERGESVTENLRRELAEEAELKITSARLRGTVTWPGFGSSGEDWLGFVFVVDGFEGDAPAANPEGDLVWVPRRRLLDACSSDEAIRVGAALPMWEGDRWFVPLVFDDDPRAFHGVMPYHDGRPTDWRMERMG
jgi:8-oxo-dGTP diphosphatase